MNIQWPLFLWIFRPLRWLTFVSAMTATGYVLFHDKPLDFRGDGYAVVFTVLHSFLISRLIGRVRSEPFAFLYSQGFSRNALWMHVWLAAVASVLATWFPCAVLILTPLRGIYQDHQLNPWFPLMAATEWPFLAWALLVYAMVLPVFQYEWIRSAMPWRGIVSGHLLAIGFFAFAILMGDRFLRYGNDPVRVWLISGFAIDSVILLVFGRWLHERMEVHA